MGKVKYNEEMKLQTVKNVLEGAMSEPGCPYDNSCVESFFATLKKEMTQMQEKSCICGENMLQWKV